MTWRGREPHCRVRMTTTIWSMVNRKRAPDERLEAKVIQWTKKIKLKIPKPLLQRCYPVPVDAVEGGAFLPAPFPICSALVHSNVRRARFRCEMRWAPQALVQICKQPRVPLLIRSCSHCALQPQGIALHDLVVVRRLA